MVIFMKYPTKLSLIKTRLSVAVLAGLCAQVALAEDEPSAHLGELQVNAYQGTKVKTNVVTTKSKDESTATDLRGLLEQEPAIDFGGGNGASQFITIRGMGQNSIDVKVDNAYSDAQVLYHQGRFTLDPSLVKIVEVQKGVGSASAGIGATNGAIVAKTLDANDLLKNSDKDHGFKINAGYSSNDEYSYGLSAFGRTDVFDVLISGNHVEQKDYTPGKGYISPYDGNDKVRFSALDKTSYLAKIGMNLGDHRFVLSHLNDTNKGVRNVREEFDWFSGQNPVYRELTLENTNLEWQAQNLGFASQVNANVYLQKITRESADDTQNGYGGGARSGGATTASVETKGANIGFDSDINDDILLKYGINYRHQTTNPAFKTSGVVDQEKTDTGAYVEAISNIGDFVLTTGLRYDHFDFKAMNGKEVSHGDLNPSIGLIWQASPNLSFNTNHNYATRSPRMIDMQLSHGARGIISVADNIKPERAKNTEVGFNYKKGNFSLNGSYFWQNIDNLLNSGSIARHEKGQIVYDSGIDNVGYAKNQGFEINASYQHKGLTARFGVAESDPEFYTTKVISYTNANGQQRTSNPSFASTSYAARLGRIWTASLAYRFANPNLEIGINHRLAEDATGSSAWMTHQGTGARQNNLYAERPGYNVTDVFANWKPYDNDKLNVNFAINNITDEMYRPHSAAASTNALPGVGREYRVGLNFTY